MARRAKLPSCAALDIILISSRGPGGASQWSRTLAARTADELASAGHRLRWLCALGQNEEAPKLDSGVELREVSANSVSFRGVESGIGNPDMERLLARELREEPAHVVHAVGFGEGASAALLWIAARMGVRPMVTLRAREFLCHRQTLVDEQGRDCRAWNDVRRCVECCLTAWEDGLTQAQARLGRWLEPLGGWSPYPNRHAFRNRLEMLLGGIDHAEMVLVGSQEDRELLDLAGVSVPIQVLS